jgi:hypothetical protein
MANDFLDWNDRPLRVARSRGGVVAICDVRRALLYDEGAGWPPPALQPKLKRSMQITAFDPPGSGELQKDLGFYCDLQSIASEDAITWSFFGPFLTASPDVRAKLLNWLLELADVVHEPSTTCEIRLWRRLPHPDTGKSSHGPEPDFALHGDLAIVLGEAKWSAKEDKQQGILGTTSQMQMRRSSLLAEASGQVDDPRLIALGIVLFESLEPAPLDAAGIETRIAEWHQLAAYSDHPLSDEFEQYYAWKLRHLPGRPGRRSQR